MDRASLSSKASFEGELRKLEPEWLENLLKQTFSGSCSEPHCVRNNLNQYCIDCDASLCNYCVKTPSHENHRCLRIYRHSGGNVVPVEDIEQYIEHSQIQEYRHKNGHQVLALTPLPHRGPKRSDSEEKCRICNKVLNRNLMFHIYCSIPCKARAFTEKADYNSPPFLSLDMLVPNGTRESEEEEPGMLVPNGTQESEEEELDMLVPNERQESEEEEELIVDHPAKRAKLDCDVSGMPADDVAKKEEIAQSTMILADELVQKEESDLNKAVVGHQAEVAQQESELEMLACEQLVQLSDQAPRPTESTRTSENVPRRRLSF